MNMIVNILKSNRTILSEGNSFNINNDNGILYLGSSEVTDTYYSYKILPNESLYIHMNENDSIYALSTESNLNIEISYDE